ncbi:hypothetical protein [Mycobacterium neglectum]|jgi:hypothetical protein|uniref:hypothetical protein n=1 Tax=Mycobacterium neglectum TaxID=242737 RepID=UPI000BFEBA24|nr:hypothetical protein [Mycobacterium neglectum]
MADNKIPAEIISSFSNAGSATPDRAVPRSSLASRLTARLRAGQFDGLLAVGVPAPAGSALAVHEARLTSNAEREAIARSLRATVTDARGRGLLLSSRVPLHVANITAAEDVIDAITLRLHAPRPVSARGMARLRQILGDGTGPLYRYGHGDLRGRLGAALAAL